MAWVFYDDKYYLPHRVTLLEKFVITALERKLNSLVGYFFIGYTN